MSLDTTRSAAVPQAVANLTVDALRAAAAATRTYSTQPPP